MFGRKQHQTQGSQTAERPAPFAQISPPGARRALPRLMTPLSVPFKIMACGALWLCAVCAQAQTAADILQRGYGLTNAAIPLYDPLTLRLSAVVRVQRVFLDHERRGFFHIGILPVEVFDGFGIELRDQTAAPAVLQQISRSVPYSARQQIVLRHFKLLYPGGALEADRVVIGDAGQWDLAEGVKLACSGREELRAGHGSLQTSGLTAGLVVLEDPPRTTLNLFQASVLKTVNKSSTPSNHE